MTSTFNSMGVMLRAKQKMISNAKVKLFRKMKITEHMTFEGAFVHIQKKWSLL